jgi:fatty acid amide hydrolase
MRHKEPYRITFNCSYTGLFNLLDFPAGTVPVTTVRREDLDNLNNYKASDYYEKLLVKSAKVKLRILRVKIFQGTLNFPVGVQVCSLPYRDEMVLRVMREIEDSIKGEKNKLL